MRLVLVVSECPQGQAQLSTRPCPWMHWSSLQSPSFRSRLQKPIQVINTRHRSHDLIEVSDTRENACSCWHCDLIVGSASYRDSCSGFVARFRHRYRRVALCRPSAQRCSGFLVEVGLSSQHSLPPNCAWNGKLFSVIRSCWRRLRKICCSCWIQILGCFLASDVSNLRYLNMCRSCSFLRWDGRILRMADETLVETWREPVALNSGSKTSVVRSPRLTMAGWIPPVDTSVSFWANNAWEAYGMRTGT